MSQDSLPSVLKSLDDFDPKEHPQLTSLVDKVTKLHQVEHFLTQLLKARLTPKQVNYLNLRWLDGLYQAYYRIKLTPNADDEIPVPPEEFPPVENLAFDLLRMKGDFPETLEYLLRQGLSPNVNLENQCELWDHLEDLQLKIDGKYDTDLSTVEGVRCGGSLLHVAVCKKKLESTRLLLAKGATVYYPELANACFYSTPEIFRVILEHIRTINNWQAYCLGIHRELLSDVGTPQLVENGEKAVFFPHHPKTPEEAQIYLDIFLEVIPLEELSQE